MSEKRMIHFKNEENGIEVSIPDGGMLRLFSENGDAQCVLCRYIDENHTEIDGVLYDTKLSYIKLVSTQILMQKILSQSVKTLRLYIRTQNCVPMQVSRMTNCVYIVAPTHVEVVCCLHRVNS